MELAIRARICQTLKWDGFPETRREFENYGSLKVHKLDVLLSLTGHQARIKTHHLTEWSVVAAWDPESRYRPIGSASRADAQLMIHSAEVLLRAI